MCIFRGIFSLEKKLNSSEKQKISKLGFLRLDTQITFSFCLRQKFYPPQNQREVFGCLRLVEPFNLNNQVEVKRQQIC